MVKSRIKGGRAPSTHAAEGGQKKCGRPPSSKGAETGQKKLLLEQTELPGKLSCTQNGTPQRITDYFETNKSKNEDNSPQRIPNTVSILQQADNIIKKSPHRIEITQEASGEAEVSKKSKTVKAHKLTDYFPVRRSIRKTNKTVLEEKQKDIENAILSGKEEGMEVHVFEGKGRGVIATRPFHKGDFVVEYSGELISIEEAKIRESVYSQDQNTGCYMYYFMFKGKQYCVDATAESIRLGRLVNHSRNGNLLTKIVCVGTEPRLVLIARDDIQPGDELSYDYGDRSKESLRHHPWLAT